MSALQENEVRPEIEPFPWPRFVKALPISWVLLLVFLVMNPGDEYGELTLGAMAAWPLVYVFTPLGQAAAVILGLLATTAAFAGVGSLLDRWKADPRVFATIWSVTTLALIVYAGFTHHQFARHLREGGTANVSVPLAAAELALGITTVLMLIILLIQRSHRDRTRFRSFRDRFRRRELDA